jgi:hypothetical protein
VLDRSLLFPKLMMIEAKRTWAIVLAGGEGRQLAAFTAALCGRPLPGLLDPEHVDEPLVVRGAEHGGIA